MMTAYRFNHKGELEVLDVRNAPRRSKHSYLVRKRGLTEGSWVGYNSYGLHFDLKKAKAAALKDALGSKKLYIKWAKEQEARTAKIRTIKVPRKAKVS